MAEVGVIVKHPLDLLKARLVGFVLVVNLLCGHGRNDVTNETGDLTVHGLTDQRMLFVEEAIGPDAPAGFKELKSRTDVQVCGGEIITTPKEMIQRIEDDVYDFVQPDASVMGGISAVMDVFSVAKSRGTYVVVHAWGGAAAIMANYHAAFAAGGHLVEYPMLAFPLGAEMMGDQARIVDGKLQCPAAPGLGLTLTPEMEARHPFDPTAVYSCALVEAGQPPDSYWK